MFAFESGTVMVPRGTLMLPVAASPLADERITDLKGRSLI